MDNSKSTGRKKSNYVVNVKSIDSVWNQANKERIVNSFLIMYNTDTSACDWQFYLYKKRQKYFLSALQEGNAFLTIPSLDSSDKGKRY